jgi:hypothetical protein
MGYTLVLSGLAGTGSASFWQSFGFHPQIQRSSEKEPRTIFEVTGFIPRSDNYISHYYKVDEKTKVLLDGSINSDEKYINFLMTVKDINRICCVFRTRDAKQKLLSELSAHIGSFLTNFGSRPNFLNEDFSFNYDILNTHIMDKLNQHVSIRNMVEKLGIDNVLIVFLNNLFENQKKVLSFLEVDSEFAVPKTNINSKKNIFINKEHFEMMKKIEEFVFNNSDKFDKVIKRSRRILYTRYNIIGGERRWKKKL